MDFETYEWIAHQAAIRRLVKLPARDRKAVLERLHALAKSTHTLESEKGFRLPNEAPYYVVTAGRLVLTLQVDHAAKELRLLALESS